MRVLLVGPRGAGARHGDARLFRQFHNAPGRALGRVEQDEVAAARARPRAALHVGKPLVQLAQHQFELRTQDGGVLGHVRGDAVGVLQETHVPQLVDLVVADGAHAHALLDFGDVFRAGGQGRNAGAGKRHFGGGGELEVAVRVAGLAACRADVEHLVLFGGVVVQVVHAVGVVPEDAEVLRRARHGGQVPHSLVGVGGAVGVGVLRHAPDALHARVVGHQALHFVHVRAVRGHGNGHHADAERLGHAEVPVVAGHRAQPFHLVELAPGLRPQRAEVPAARDALVHEREAGVAAYHHVFGGVVEHGGHEALRLGKAVQHPVVAAVGAVLGAAAVPVGHGGKQGHAQVQLVGAGLAPRHVQGQPLGRKAGVFLPQLREAAAEFVFVHGGNAWHVGAPFRRSCCVTLRVVA